MLFGMPCENLVVLCMPQVNIFREPLYHGDGLVTPTPITLPDQWLKLIAYHIQTCIEILFILPLLSLFDGLVLIIRETRFDVLFF